MAITSDQIDDLVFATLDNLGAPKFRNLLPDLQRYEVMGRLLKNKKVIPGSIGYKRKLAINKVGTAKMIGHHEVDTYTIGNHLAEFRVPWRYSTADWAYGHQEVIENMGDGNPKAQLLDMLQPRELDALTDLAELMERQTFSAPTSSADNTSVWGFRYWLPSSQTTGFNGLNPTGFSDKAGIDATAQSKWANYTAAYTDVSKNDLISKMRTGYRQIKWRSPVSTRDAVDGNFSNYRIYMDGDTFDQFELVAEGQNENLGKDVSPYNATKGVTMTGDGDILFKKHPLCWVPQEDSANGGDGSVWMINTDDCKLIVCKGNVMRRSGPHVIPNMHNDKAVHVDISWNLLFESCRGSARFVPTT